MFPPFTARGRAAGPRLRAAPARAASSHTAATRAAAWRWRAGVLAIAAGLVLTLLPDVATADVGAEEGPLVEVVQIDGVLDGRVVGHLEQALDRAVAEAAEVVVVELDSPGPLRTDARQLAERIDASPVPVIVWVGPAGAEAAGGAVLVAQAAHVLAISPASVLGGAQALDLADERRTDAPTALDEDEVAALGDELAGYAQERGRDAEIARGMASSGAVVHLGDDAGDVALDPDALPWGVLPDRLTSDDGASLVASGAVDVAAGELPDVLAAADGVEVTTAEGARTITLDPVTARVRFDNMALWDIVLHGVTGPTLAYVLLIGGLLAILFEVFQPGLGVPGITGVAVTAVAGWGLWVLPVAWWALALVLLGLALLAVDLAIGGLGWLTAGGTASLAIGSWQLFAGPPPLQPIGWAVALIVVFAVVFFVGILTTVLRAQGQQSLAGAEQVLGEVGVVRSILNPEGHVYAGGALWRARAPDDAGKVPTGTTVRVTGVDTDRAVLEVEVETSEDAARSGV